MMSVYSDTHDVQGLQVRVDHFPASGVEEFWIVELQVKTSEGFVHHKVFTRNRALADRWVAVRELANAPLEPAVPSQAEADRTAAGDAVPS